LEFRPELQTEPFDPRPVNPLQFIVRRPAAILGDGVTVAQQFLVLLVQVRILIPQFFFQSARHLISFFDVL
jgi:hypothetical protein